MIKIPLYLDSQVVEDKNNIFDLNLFELQSTVYDTNSFGIFLPLESEEIAEDLFSGRAEKEVNKQECFNLSRDGEFLKNYLVQLYRNSLLSILERYQHGVFIENDTSMMVSMDGTDVKTFVKTLSLSMNSSLDDYCQVLVNLDWISELKVIINLDEIEVKEDRIGILIASEGPGLYLFQLKVNTEQIADIEKKLSGLYAVLKLMCNRNEKINKNTDPAQELEGLFNLLPMGVVVIGANSQFAYCNQFFGELEIDRDLLTEMKNDQVVKIKNCNYKVYKSPIDIDQVPNSEASSELMVFSPIISEYKSEHYEDLGVITASIAHELNNPLAGVAAGLELIGALNQLDQEQTEFLNDMIKSTSRCKKLIETLLGFSRKNLNAVTVPVSEVFVRAVELLRGKMIENNVKINITQEQNVSVFMVDQSLVSMALYVVLSEYITAYSYHLLMTFQERGKSKVINLNSKERAESFVINFESVVIPVAEISHLELVQNLLKIDHLAIDISSSRIKIMRLN